MKPVTGAIRVFGVLAGAAWLAACGSGEPPPETDSLAAVCHEADECEPVANLTGHGGGEELGVYYNPDLDDEVTRWASCLDAGRLCFEAGGDVAACLAAAEACPEQCADAFAERYSPAGPVTEALDAFESVFINEDAMCRAGEVWQ